MTLWCETAMLQSGWVQHVRLTIDGGWFTAIETGAQPVSGDVRCRVAVPGLPNLHSHAFQRGMAGLAETAGPGEDSFWSWRDTMYRFVARIGPDDLLAIAAMAQVEMLEGGFTRVGEFHYLHHDCDGGAFDDPAEMAAAVARASGETGIGLTLLPVFYATGGFGGAATGPGQRRFVTDPDGYARLIEASRIAVGSFPDSVVGIAPHSLRAVTPEMLGEIMPLAVDGPIHIHAAEQRREVADCLAWSGQRPVEWLLNHAPVDARWCLVHATHMTAEETGALAASGAVAGLCPITEANLGDGIFPAVDYLAAGGAIGVGSDSNVRIDAAEELRLLEYGQRLRDEGRNRLAGGAGRSTGARLYRAALAGGAQALGVDGGLAIGASADIVTLDADHPSLVARSGDALIDGLVFGDGRAAIHQVWRHGRLVVDRGRHVARDAIAARFGTTMRRLLA
ncbi:formimidoylglutamate deiminase [Sphingomonas sp. 1P06PA]